MKLNTSIQNYVLFWISVILSILVLINSRRRAAAAAAACVLVK